MIWSETVTAIDVPSLTVTSMVEACDAPVSPMTLSVSHATRSVARAIVSRAFNVGSVLSGRNTFVTLGHGVVLFIGHFEIDPASTSRNTRS